MPLSPLSPDSAVYLPSYHSDIVFECTDREVMAEQISHNVVNNPESASGSPLVDVIANQTTTAPAASGTTNALEANTTNDLATDANANTAADHASIGAVNEGAAEPSAGDVATKAAEVPSIPAVTTAEERGEAGQGELANGIHDAAQGDIAVDDGSTPDVSVDLNSDTDISRGEAAEQNKDGKRHVRAPSVKKPTTFSRVSVTKNFLAKSASTTPTPAAPSPAGKRMYSRIPNNMDNY